MSAAETPSGWSLLADGSLRLEVDPRLLPAVERWIPLHCSALSTDATAAATIELQWTRSQTPAQRPGPPTLRLGKVEARVEATGGRVGLFGPSGAHGVVDLKQGRAEIRAAGPSDEVAADLYAMLTVASAFLLGRLGGALIHSAAVIAPSRGGWLLVGDARAGKSTTTLNLITSGWNYLSDDQVILSLEESGSISAEGWLRPFHIDAGWPLGCESERRESVDPSTLGPGRWQRRAALVGTLFLELRRASRTEVERLGSADALAAIVRQSPWLMADPVQAPALLALLIATVQQPTFRLFLGRDTYRDGTCLLECLRPILEDA